VSSINEFTQLFRRINTYTGIQLRNKCAEIMDAQGYVFFRSPPVVIGGLDLQLKELSRELNPDDIIISSEGMIP